MGGSVSENDVQLLNMKFNRFMDRATDFTPLWPSIEKEFRNEVGLIFGTEGEHGRGGSWPELAESTVEDRIRKGFEGEHPILERTGALKDSLISRNAAFACIESSPRALFIGTQVRYAIYHQSRAPRHKIPRRAFLYITKEFRLFITRAMHRFMVKGELSG